MIIRVTSVNAIHSLAINMIGQRSRDYFVAAKIVSSDWCVSVSLLSVVPLLSDMLVK